MLFEYPDFTLYYSFYQHTWELRCTPEHELYASTCAMILDIIEHHNLNAPLLFWREADTSLSFGALRVLERRANFILPAIACISPNMSTRRAIQIALSTIVCHPQCQTFSCEDEARDWLVRITQTSQISAPVRLHAPMA